MGMLDINIVTINGVEDRTRGMLLQTNDEEKIDLMGKMLRKVDNITITALRPPKLVDILAVRHGRISSATRMTAKLSVLLVMNWDC